MIRLNSIKKVANDTIPESTLIYIYISDVTKYRGNVQNYNIQERTSV